MFKLVAFIVALVFCVALASAEPKPKADPGYLVGGAALVSSYPYAAAPVVSAYSAPVYSSYGAYPYAYSAYGGHYGYGYGYRSGLYY